MFKPLNNKATPMWYYSLMLALGGLMLILACLFLRKSLFFLHTGEKAMGTVTELTEYNDADGRFYSPVFTFRTSNNEEYKYHLNMSSSPSAWSVGEQQMLIYHPDDPQTVRMLSYFGIFNWAILLTAAGLPLLVIGGGYYLAVNFLK
ncbi:DUF3592 domain-containing protein [Chitinophaga sp. 212800010-3]|uniref:DUF3592 domain-containing protein n=1 Tax=unclassified Chitinophaga TaxID=2619133 RepID=UPI002E1289D7